MSTTTYSAADPTSAEFVRAAAKWPSTREIVEKYGVTLDFVRSAVERGLVESMRLDRIRVNEETWIEFLRSRHTPRQK